MEGFSVAEIVAQLDLAPHPEGGHFRETFRDEHGTAILYLLEAGECSHWHRVMGSAETWHHLAGGPLALTLSPNGHDAEAHRLGKALAMGEMPQHTVPADWWQTAESLGHWTLCACTVAPAFSFENFEMAPPDWRPMPRSS
ncbi:cupin domain-containing protein [Ahrensia sp. R2A130]|uniref:cupin domain-containing protein n=1 Tax=Ahrensia sp. R2A130 TaxID=744979 RepID=UPI0001E0E8E5|nr:cupin domain-containing protein [Ahrensia sp. R2A130]EFL87999.1 cupin superfamily protein [Ahrensia sp. R2A130]